MPYNTRRKSLSLPALGIQLPQSSRARRVSHPKPSTPLNLTAAAAPADDAAADARPTKRVKRSHSNASPTSPAPPAAAAAAPAPAAKTVTFADRPRSRGHPAAPEYTPPPSPGPSGASRVDLKDINDDIVVGVIEQLETTGNRPHLIKELATVLSTTNQSVSNSANPAALLSSRLASYMRRPWTALAPCPIAKEQIPVHPRNVFYYLTTIPRQPLPTGSAALEALSGAPAAGGKRIISPSLSNASQDDDDDNASDASMAEDRKRAALSPSPEIDLSLDLEGAAPDPHHALPDFPTPGSTLSRPRASRDRDGQAPARDLGLNRRAASPALEGDEREFTNTAHTMRLRGLSGSRDLLDAAAPIDADRRGSSAQRSADGETDSHRGGADTAHTLFDAHAVATGASTGMDRHALAPPASEASLSSPMIKPLLAYGGEVFKSEPTDTLMDGIAALDVEWEIGCPEHMDLDELDDFFDGY